MFSFETLVPFAEGESCALAVRKGVLRLSGTAEVRRLAPDRLVIAAHIPRQALVVPQTRLVYRYRLGEDGRTGKVAIRWRGQDHVDEAARLEPAPAGDALKVDMLFDPEKGVRLAYTVARTENDALEIRDVTGPTLSAGARIVLTRERRAN